MILDSPELIRYKKLLINVSLMRYLKSGKDVSVDIDERFNKSFGRGNIKILLYDDVSRNETIEKELFAFYGAGMQAGDVLTALFPWAEFDIDHDFYKVHFDREGVEFV